MIKRLKISPFFAVALVWFTTHFGGGFASGRQVVEYYNKFGWYAVFTPIISLIIMASVYYIAWNFTVAHGTYNYKSWANAFFKPYERFFSTIYEILFNLILLTATAVAFATGGATLKETLGTPYVLNTVLIAVAMFFLTIYGAEVIRKAASLMAFIIIAGLIAIYGSSFIDRLPQIFTMLNRAPSPGGLGIALWKAVVYAGFQSTLIGAFVAVADVLKTKKDALKATIWGFIINCSLLWLASVVLLSFYPRILPESVPVLYVVKNGKSADFMELVVSVLILLGVVSSGVNLIYGGVRRVMALWSKNGNSKEGKTVNLVASGIYVIITWGIALFGLIPLIAKGYGYIGYIAVFAIIIPVLLKGFQGKN